MTQLVRVYDHHDSACNMICSRMSMVWVAIWLIPSTSYGYDAYYTCSKPYRSAKFKAFYPCDLNSQTWCTEPGSSYPWRAVRRFVYENHGLMRRMYGDERHISVLRSLIDTNDILNDDDKWSKKHMKIKKEEYLQEKAAKVTPNSASSAPTKATVKTTTPSVPTVATTGMWGDGATTTEPIDATMLEADDSTTVYPTTTNEYNITTGETELDKGEKIKPIIFQDTVEKPNANYDNQMLYKSKGVNACPVKEEVVAPFWANNTRGEVLALLNLYPFEQYVHWERCTFEKKQMFCRQGCKCEQQYRLHRLLAYDPSNDCRGIFSDWFKFPSCCVCKCYDLSPDLRVTSRSPRTAQNSSHTD